MKRRRLLAATASLAATGCLSSTSSEHDEPSTTTDATVTEPTLATRETTTDQLETAVTGTVENTGDVRLDMVTVAGTFFNADGQLLGSSEWGVRDLESGETWEPWIPYTGDEDVDHAALTVTDAVDYDRIVSPDGVVLESHELQIPDDHTMPRLLGTVVNHSDTNISTLQARLKVLAENGNLLETALASIRDVGAGVMWKFDQQIHFTNPAWKDRINGSQIILTM